MNKTLGAKAIENRLNEYFTENYEEYEDTAEWYVNPSDNQVKCDIEELNVRLILTCDSITGMVTETRTNIK